jgi:hypothetical protein
MADGILTLNAMMPEKNLTGEKLFNISMLEPGLGAGIGLALASYLKSKKDKKRGIGDNNPPSSIEEEKPPKKEPPEDPDLLPEILNLKDINLDKEKRRNLTEEDFKKLEEEQKWFPFSKEDFEGGALDNEIIKKVYKFVRGDYHDPPQPFDRDKFYLTPPRGQQEIALKFLKQKLIADGANSKIIEHISRLQKNLANMVEKRGYFGDVEAESTGIGKALTEGYGYVKDLKRKKNATGGLIDKPLTGRSRDI